MTLNGWLRRAFHQASPSRQGNRFGSRPILELLEDRSLLTLLGNQVFPLDNPWNQKITNAPVAANSATLVASIGLSRGLHPDFGNALYQGGLVGIPWNAVPGTQPKITVVIDAYASESDLLPIPIPTGAVIEGDPLPSGQNTGDRHLLVYDKDNNLLYETFNTHRPSEEPDGKWHADSEAVWDLKKDSFRTPGFTSADAAGLPILPGLVRADDVLDQGKIDHAIRFTVPRSANTYVFPASHQAGNHNPALPRMGERFRLKQSFNISGYSPANRVILQALKDYGLIVADNGSGWFLSGEPSSRWNDSDLHNLSSVLSDNFEALDLTPGVSGLVQTFGPNTGGTGVTINGHGFSGGAGLIQVMFGTAAATNVAIVSDTQITCVSPLHGVGLVDVTVQSPYGTTATSGADQFTYTLPGPQPGQLQFSAAVYNANETAGIATITVSRTLGSTGIVSIHYATSDGTALNGTDYTAASGTLSLADSQTSATFTIPILIDSQIQGAESVNLTLTTPTGGAALGSQSTAVLRILDNDATLNQRFVGQVYIDLLQRPADAGGLSAWSALLNTGVPRSQFVQAIEGSTEYRSKHVQAIYVQLLHRSADSGGLSLFVQFVAGGGTYEQVQATIASSGEYFQNHGGTNGGFVDALYQDALLRAADSTGRAGFLAALAGGATRKSVADAIFQSDEYHQGLVRGYYQQFLHRPADSAGLAAWVTALRNGTRDEDVIAAFIGSPEYYGLL